MLFISVVGLSMVSVAGLAHNGNSVDHINIVELRWTCWRTSLLYASLSWSSPCQLWAQRPVFAPSQRTSRGVSVKSRLRFLYVLLRVKFQAAFHTLCAVSLLLVILVFLGSHFTILSVFCTHSNITNDVTNFTETLPVVSFQLVYV